MGSCLSFLWPSSPSESFPLTSPSKQSKQSTEPGERPNGSREELTVGTGGSSPTESRKKSDFANAVYYPNWRIYDRQSPGSLNLENVSHLFYAFAKLHPDGSVILSNEHADYQIPVDGTHGCIKAFRKLQRDRYPLLKLILSIGGEADAKVFDKVTSDEARLERLVSTARTLVDVLEMNGIDIDWEYPLNETQSRQYTSLMARLRDALPSPQYILTTAVPAGLWALRHMNLGEVSRSVDMISIMAYDFVGPWKGITSSGHHAQLRCPASPTTATTAEDPDSIPVPQTSGESAIRYLLSAGVAREKLLLGIPLYGRSFLGATGPDQQFTGQGGYNGGIFEVRELPIHQREEPVNNDAATDAAAQDVDAIVPCDEQFDAQRVAAWCVGPQTPSGGGFVTYDNAMAVEAKAAFVKEEGLAGLFYWHIGFDKPRGEGSLVDVGAEVLGVGIKRTSWWARYR